MIQILKNNNAGNIIGVSIKYPSRLHRKADHKDVANEELANAYINKKVKDFLLETLAKYARQQQFVLQQFGSYRHREDYFHACKILQEVEELKGRHVTIVMAAIYWMEKSIRAIAPSPSSRYYHHYTEIIDPMIEFCRVYSFNARRKART